MKKRITKLDKARIQQNKEKRYNLGMMLKNGTITREYYDAKMALIK